MAEIICILNRKGGVGKTTTAQALGAGLMDKGYKVLFIDLDSQANLSLINRAAGNYKSIYDVLNGTDINEAIQTTPEGETIRGDMELSTLDKLNVYTLKNALEGLRGQYDFIIIDTAPALDRVVYNALAASNGVVITSQADIFSLQGIKTLYSVIESVRDQINRDLKINGILLTRHNTRTVLSRQMQEQINNQAAEMGTRLYNVTIREGVAVKEAQAMQQNIYDYAGKSGTAEDYRAFVDEFLKDYQ